MEVGKVKKIVFLTGTRADFGKLKSVISYLKSDPAFEVHIFATGMHLKAAYGNTVMEIEKFGLKNIHKFINYSGPTEPETIFSNTVAGFGSYVRELKPDMIVVHGDRSEALAGALVGAFNNILVAHIEGGEVSGTIDETVRHTISKIAHLHFVANKEAKKRLIQMGEKRDAIFVIGSPDIDIMVSENLPTVEKAKRTFDIPFDNYGIFIFHPVTTEVGKLTSAVHRLSDALLESGFNFVGVYPNNDPGTDIIMNAFKEKLFNHPRFVIHPSMRFEHFLSLLKDAHFIIGNSSAGVREAPYYGVPAINVGTRQRNRVKEGKIRSIVNSGYDRKELLGHINRFSAKKVRFKPKAYFGKGNSGQNFYEILKNKQTWKMNLQKQFSDIDF